jgi:Tol biopolymer transport system component
MSLQPGAHLGPYEILAPLGAGGMGEVWKAKDTRLDRFVAVKVLPEHLAKSPEALARFEREAKAVAALNHPNITGIHDFATQGETTYVVMELLEGESLRTRLEQGPFTPRKATDLAIQVAQGLAAAHEKGAVHRDLKPDNLWITRDGRLKILDFGLAKQLPTLGAGSDSRLATAALSPGQQTSKGMILGTVGYMSPEQVKGEAVDARADIFSFGVVLYEMLTGRRAFARDSAPETLAAILKEDPQDFESALKALSPALQRVLEHCLEKNPALRFQGVRDLGFALENLSSNSDPSAPLVLPAADRKHRMTLVWAGLVAVTLTALAFVGGRQFHRAPEPMWSGRLLGGPEFAMGPRVSPDGHTLAFLVLEKEQAQIALMKPESGNWLLLTRQTGAGDVNHVAWSPDGNWLYYDRVAEVAMGVYRVPALGGQEQMVLEGAEHPEPLPDGSLLLMKLNTDRERQLNRFWPDTGRLQPFGLMLGDVYWPQMRLFPGGREAIALARIAQSGDTEFHLSVVNLESGLVRRIPSALPEAAIDALAVSLDGESLLVAIRTDDLTKVVRIPRNGGRQPVPLFTTTERIRFLDCAADGSVYLDTEVVRPAVLRFPAKGGRAVKYALSTQNLKTVMVCLPDGRILMVQSVAGRQRLVALEQGKDPVPILNTSEEASEPLTLAGSGEVAFMLGTGPHPAIALASLANGRITRKIPFDKGRVQSLSASPDGKTIYCAAEGSIWSLADGSEPRRLCAGDAVAADPGGRNLLVWVRGVPRTRLVQVPVDGGEVREVPLQGSSRVVANSVNSAALSRDGRLFAALTTLDSWFFWPGVIDLATGKTTRIGNDYFGDYQTVVMLPDGQVAARVNDWRSELWKFTPEAPK